MAQASTFNTQFTDIGLFVIVVAEYLTSSIEITDSAADAVNFDGIFVLCGAEGIFANGISPLYPLSCPRQILENGYCFGNPVGSMGSGRHRFPDSRN